MMMASRLSPLRKPLIAAAAVCAAAVCVGAAVLQAPAFSSPRAHKPYPYGWTVEYWGAVGTAGHEYDRNLSPATLNVPSSVVQVASSNSTEYALLSDGTVWAWGIGSNGELGDGGRQDSFGSAVQVQFPAGVRIAFLPADVMPYDSAFAVDTTGHVWAWGMNRGGEFCEGNEVEYDKPVELPLSDVTALAGAAQHATFDANGTLYSCGQNQYGELGDGTFVSSTTPVKVFGLDGNSVTDLVASWGDTGALLSNGNYFDWGFNSSGQLGDGSRDPSAAPVEVDLPGSASQVAQGGSLDTNGQTLAILSDGEVYGWGSDSYGQLGSDSRLDHARADVTDSPVRIYPPDGVTYETVASGGETSYAISDRGDVYAWGGNKDGQVGDGNTRNVSQPILVESGVSLISATATDVLVSANSDYRAR
jgi:alpha-tubulin suppressor-like RCC1 family protein